MISVSTQGIGKPFPGVFSPNPVLCPLYPRELSVSSSTLCIGRSSSPALWPQPRLQPPLLHGCTSSHGGSRTVKSNGSQLESFHLVIYPSVAHLDPVTGRAVSALGSCVPFMVTCEPADVASVHCLLGCRNRNGPGCQMESGC